MIISVFEKQQFTEWCQKELPKHKYVIIEKGICLLKSTINDIRKLESIDKIAELILDNLNEIRIVYQKTTDEKSLRDSILITEALMLAYNFEGIYKKALDNNINKAHLVEFFNLLSIYITDATVAHWKTIRKLHCNLIKIENNRGDKGFFPISYELGDYINFIKKELKKEIVFISGELTKNTVIKRNCIEVYFPKNRLKCEYSIQLQLFDMWMHHKKYQVINRYAFANYSKLELSNEILRDCIMYLLQHKYSTLYFQQNFSIWDDKTTGAILAFACSEDSFFGAYKYICSMLRPRGCGEECDSLLTKFRDIDNTCPIHKYCGDIMKLSDISLLDTPEKMEELVDKYLSDILNC